MRFFLCASLLGLAFCQSTNRSQTDLVTNGLPGTTFQVTFNQYAGYLSGGTPDYPSTSLHYWYMESQNNVTTDPLIVFFNGGPGCSSVFGMMEEIGPFRVYPAGDTLYENVFSWNKVSNLLVIDAPGVGFSIPTTHTQNDDYVSSALEAALYDFYSVYPERLPNPLYVTGEGYASVFASRVAHLMQVRTVMPVGNLKGVIIANGMLNAQIQFNSILAYSYMHGFAGKDEWDDLRSVCCPHQSSITCDYYNSPSKDCQTKAQAAVTGWLTNLVDPYNLYQDCYRNVIMLNNTAHTMGLQLQQFNSSDPFNAFPCTAQSATNSYLSRTDVRTALHVNTKAIPIPFKSCIQIPYGDKATDISVLLSNIINNVSYDNGTQRTYKIILYNGDIDTVSNFIGAQLFGQQFAAQQGLKLVMDEFWKANYYRFIFRDSDGGIRMHYEKNFHVVSIRGAGHFTPQSRPAQTLQVIRNIIMDHDYNNCLSAVPLGAAPLLPQYHYLQQPTIRKMADQILELPGVTFQTNFKQYSGYLSGSPSHKLHYWLVESQLSPSTAPLLLWLNGGPGSSSVWGMLTENGPFRPNRDGYTLYENLYSWNKFANVLYLEAPYGVGYSYSTVANETAYGDDMTADDNYNALVDFFSVYPEYQGREFFITGESYGGVYIPTLSRRLLNGIFNNNLNINFKGIAIGNGELTTKLQVNSVIFQLYTYGLLGKVEYDELVTKCCPQNITDPTLCDFYGPYIYMDYLGNYKARDGADAWCAKTIISIAGDQVWNTANDPYNIYQDCYNYPETPSNSPDEIETFADNARRINMMSTDPFNAFPCWGADMATPYMNRPDVRKALHIPDFVQPWQQFSQQINEVYYNRSYFEMDGEMSFILNNYIYDKNNMRTLIYNGDVDMVCNHLGDQWFIEQLAANLNLTTVSSRQHWSFMVSRSFGSSVAGYIKKFSKNLNLVTVKGSGHLVPMDRPQVALQMIYNFVMNLDIGSAAPLSLTPAPMLPDYQGLSDCQPIAQPVPSILPTIPIPSGLPIGEDEAESLLSDIDINSMMDDRIEEDAGNLTAQATADQIKSLPGLTFTPPYRMFSGYLLPDEHNHIFYWFIESQNDSVNDPVVLWLNGGPGCSGLGGFFEELGPLHNNNDEGQTVYENVYSWNKRANVLFIEAPVGVGFSFTTEKDYYWSDDTTADVNARSIKYFFENVFPQYAENEFYVTGESYAGVYGPTLTLNLIQMIQSKQLSINFKGMAIGNGILSEYLQTNSEMVLQYGKGFNGVDNWNELKSLCGGNSTNPLYYDYSSGSTACQTYGDVYQNVFYETAKDPYNTYQDCYYYPPDSSVELEKVTGTRGQRTLAAHMNRQKLSSSNKPFTNTNDKSWYGSTDPFFGFPCFNDDSMTKYLNREDVRKAIHADPHRKHWTDCSNLNYHELRKYYNMTDTFNSIMDSNLYKSNNMRIMLYNGDVDTICQFLGDEWFIENLVINRNLTVSSPRQPWFYQLAPQYPKNIAGYAKSWNQNLVQLTVKGSGHFVPMDRPAQALQMLLNFLDNSNDYSIPKPVDLTPQPLLPQYASKTSKTCSRKDSDRVLSLPGLSENVPFKQWSGFLKASDTHYLHYWLVESEISPSTAPLLLWLNGGPGSSSLDGMFEEHGPFRLNKDGKTLSRNQNSWNKFANVLFLESPVGVGYSYSTDGQQPVWSDQNTANENLAALKDFFLNVFPEYQSRPFYATGESYAGVYLPMLTELLINNIQNGTLNINFKGTAIGNGVLDKAIDVNSLVHTEYYRGGLTHSNYTTINQLCCPPGKDEMECRYDLHISDFNPIVYSGNQSDICYDALISMGIKTLVGVFDAYNLYEQCYRLLDANVTQPAPVGETWTGINYDSSDANNGYWCYQDNAIVSYMNMDSTRKALNIPDGTGPWVGDTNIILAYQQQVNSTDTIFTRIINSPYYNKSDFQLLIYSGDVDTMCNWLMAEWFTNELFKTKLGLQIKQVRQAWTYQSASVFQPTMGGFAKKYSKNIDVLTIKGAGHFVPQDRPAQAQQMMFNWLSRNDYSTPYVPANLPSTTSSPTTTTVTTTQTPPSTSTSTVSTTPSTPPTTSSATSSTTSTTISSTTTATTTVSSTTTSTTTTKPVNVVTTPTTPAPSGYASMTTLFLTAAVALFAIL